MPQKYFFKNNNRFNNLASLISPVGFVRGKKFFQKDLFLPAGISIVDYLGFVKKVYKNEKSYALDAVAEKHLGQGKEFKEVNFSWLTEEVKQRNIGDVKLMVNLEKKKFKLLPLFDDARRMAQIGWEDLEFPLRIVEPYFFRKAKAQKVCLPKRTDREKVTEENFEGAFRKAFETGRFFGMSKDDLSGAYLNAVIDLNLDSTNISTEKVENSIPVKFFACSPSALTIEWYSP